MASFTVPHYGVSTFREEDWNHQTVSKELDPSGKLSYCRWWYSNPRIVDDKLFIDGGHVYWKENPETEEFHLEPNDRMVIMDLNKPQSYKQMQLSSVSTPAEKPPMQLSNIFNDANGNLYFPGGGYITQNTTAVNYIPPPKENTPTNEVIKFNPKSNKWTTETFKGDKFINVVGAAGAQAPNAAYSLNGYRNYMTEEKRVQSNDLVPQRGLLKFDFETMSIKNITTPFPALAHAFMEYVPLGKKGILVAFGGSAYTPNLATKDTARVAPPMTKIRIFDIDSETWHEQTATGVLNGSDPSKKETDVPVPRQMGCSSLAMAPDGSSANIYMYGGEMPPYGFPDVYILSLPSFRWLKAPVDNMPQSIAQKCVSQGRNMFVLGALETPQEEVCQAAWKVLDMTSLSFTNAHDPKDTRYTVPLLLSDVIGGTEEGGATMLEPEEGWTSEDLKSVFLGVADDNKGTKDSKPKLQKPTDSDSPSSSPLSSSPDSTGISNGVPTRSNTGTIVGAAVGSILGILALALLLFLCLRRRRTRQRSTSQSLHSIDKPALGTELADEKAAYLTSHKASPDWQYQYEQGACEAPNAVVRTEMAAPNACGWASEADSGMVHELHAAEVWDGKAVAAVKEKELPGRQTSGMAVTEKEAAKPIARKPVGGPENARNGTNYWAVAQQPVPPVRPRFEEIQPGEDQNIGAYPSGFYNGNGSGMRPEQQDGIGTFASADYNSYASTDGGTNIGTVLSIGTGVIAYGQQPSREYDSWTPAYKDWSDARKTERTRGS